MIIWAQNSYKVTGQSKITDAIIGMQLHTQLFTFSLNSTYLKSLIRLYIAIFTDRKNFIYFVPSRSKLGMVKDIPIVLLSLFGVKIIGHLHGSDSTDFLTYVEKFPLIRTAYLRITFISPSEILTKQLSKKAYKCVTIENFYDEPNSRQYHCVDTIDEGVLNGKQHLVVWNSNIMASKGVFEVLGAIENLNKDGVDIHLCLFGIPITDVEMNAQEAWRRLKIYESESYITYLGSRRKEDIDAMLAKAQTVVLPSRYPTECQPLGLIEAMLNDCNVIIANRGVLLETVGLYKNTIVVEPTLDSIQGGLLKAMQLPVRKCDPDTQKRFSFERFSHEFKDLIKKSYRN